MVAPAHARQGLRLNQLDTLSELSLNEDILRAFGESSLAEARPEAREPIQRRGVRSPARLDVRQSHMLFLQPDCDTVVAPVADFRSAGSMWRSTASLAALPLRAASPSARPAGERPVLASHDVEANHCLPARCLVIGRSWSGGCGGARKPFWLASWGQA